MLRRKMTTFLEQWRANKHQECLLIKGARQVGKSYAVERFGMEVSFASHMDSVEQVLRAVVDRGIGIECNTNRGHMPLPGAEILKRYRQLGGEIITLGSDAHRPQHVGLGIREGRQLLQACGFSYVCTFEKMQPIFHKL